jgi:hypothetical protein
MGKPLQLFRGTSYFIARCPKSNEILDAIRDPGPEAAEPATGEWIVACPDCGSHTLDLAKIRPEQFG